MAFVKSKRGAFQRAFEFDKDSASVEGYLWRFKQVKTKANKNPSNLYSLVDAKISGTVEFWGSAVIDRELLDEKGELYEPYRGAWIRVTFRGIEKIKGGKKLKQFDIEVDAERKMNLKKSLPF